jgi:hypothetical protein
MLVRAARLPWHFSQAALRRILNMTRHSTSRLSIGTGRAALCLIALAMVPVTASAYIDPGTGSLLFQSLLGVLFGVGVGFRKLKDWCLHLWSRIVRRPPPDPRDPE